MGPCTEPSSIVSPALTLSGFMIHPAGSVGSSTEVELVTWVPVAMIAAVQALIVSIGALQVSAVKIEEEVMVLFVIRSLQGHSIKGLRPLCRFVMLLLTMAGMKDGW